MKDWKIHFFEKVNFREGIWMFHWLGCTGLTIDSDVSSVGGNIAEGMTFLVLKSPLLFMYLFIYYYCNWSSTKHRNTEIY